VDTVGEADDRLLLFRARQQQADRVLQVELRASADAARHTRAVDDDPVVTVIRSH